jgi:putative heme-binding domain-containing protein
MRHPDVSRFLSDADVQIVVEAARAINDDGAIEKAVPSLAAILNEERFSSEPLLRRAINANLRVGTNDALSRLAAFAGDSSHLAAMRAEAISALGVWIDPSPLDRVDGMYLGPAQGTRDAAAARAAVQKLVESISTAETTPAIKIALADAAGRLGVIAAVPVLLGQIRSDPSPDVRLAALRAMQALKAPNLGEVMKTALSDSDPAVRRAALGILPSLPIPDAAKVQHLASVIESRSLQEQQGALEVLGTIKSPDAHTLLGTYFDRLAAGKLAPELQIDLVDAIQSSESKPLEAKLATYQKARKADSLVEAFRDALLSGGQSNRGRQVYTDHAAAGCPRCHSLGGRGADVGPNLTNIGTMLSREQLLQSLLEPNARIAPGFGTVSITLKNGQQVDGTLRDETDTHLVVAVGTPPVAQRVAKSEIAQRTDPVSAMPPMGLLLKPREIRDLVQFLSTLK